MRPVDQKHVTLPLGILVERRESTHRWGSTIWKPVAAFMTTERPAPWTETLRGDGFVQYNAGTLDLVLHRKETEALVENLRLDAPQLYILLHQTRPAGDPFPYDAHRITASPYEAEDFHGWTDAVIGKVAMPEPVAVFLEAFIEVHHAETPFRKRRRDRLDAEEQKFGKAAVFTPLTRQ